MRQRRFNFHFDKGTVVTHQKDFAATEISTKSEFLLVRSGRIISELIDDAPR